MKYSTATRKYLDMPGPPARADSTYKNSFYTSFYTYSVYRNLFHKAVGSEHPDVQSALLHLEVVKLKRGFSLQPFAHGLTELYLFL